MTAPNSSRRRAAPFVALCATLAALAGPSAGDPPAKTAPAPARQAPGAALRIGIFPLAPAGIVDGDTIRVQGKPSIRLLCADTEETFKNQRHRLAATTNFAAYAREMRGDSKRPVKYGTPAGEAARTALIDLARGVTHVRLERDEPNAREVGNYGRLLAHVFLLRPGGDINLAEWLIRQGHSPYFVKYGRSVRFHALFQQAQAEARAAKRGIWSDTGPAHYPDYPDRLAWWTARDKQLQAWRAVAKKPAHITLGTPGANAQLKALVGKPVTVFGTYERLIESETSARKILILSHERRRGLPLVVFDPSIYAQLDLPAITSMYVRATGTLSLYRGRPQIIVKDPAQVVAR